MEHASPQADHAAPDEERELAQSSARIDQILGELQGLVSAPGWQRIEELVREMLSLYGVGLSRVLNCAAASTADSARLQQSLCDDPLVSSLLLVHGLHPVGFVERVQAALERVRPYLGSHAGGIELAGVSPEGVVRVKMLGSCRGCPSSAATVEHTVRQAIEEAAPEVSRIEVEGTAHAEPSGTVVSLRARGAEHPGAKWEPVPGLAEMPPGTTRQVELGAAPVVVLNVEGNLVAYRNRCPACGAPLHMARLDRSTLHCGCGAAFDAAHAGRALGGGELHLSPVPLLVEDGVALLSLAREIS
jgi:Fe-S cluster biogenesis protein NfuA/nitrite reductase/ring-hydroxylating ferredoxin subunit